MSSPTSPLRANMRPLHRVRERKRCLQLCAPLVHDIDSHYLLNLHKRARVGAFERCRPGNGAGCVGDPSGDTFCRRVCDSYMQRADGSGVAAILCVVRPSRKGGACAGLLDVGSCLHAGGNVIGGSQGRRRSKIASENREQGQHRRESGHRRRGNLND